MPSKKKDKIREVTEAISAGRLDAFDQALADHFSIHDPVDGNLDREGFKRMIGKYRTAFPDLTMTSDEVVEAGDRVLHRWTCRGTHRGSLQGLAPTNKPVEIHGISVIRFEGDKPVEEWVEWDALGLMRQVGALPEAQPSAG
jgi:steroid delta-isomerase-like uncharacterized protein